VSAPVTSKLTKMLAVLDPNPVMGAKSRSSRRRDPVLRHGLKVFGTDKTLPISREKAESFTLDEGTLVAAAIAITQEQRGESSPLLGTRRSLVFKRI